MNANTLDRAPVAASIASRPSFREGMRASSLALLKLGVSACLLVALASAIPDAGAAGTYYRWRDAQGKLVVSDRPPTDQDISYEVVNPNSPLIRRVAPGEGAVPPETSPRPGNEFDPVNPRTEREEVQKNPESCARARSNLETLNSSARIRIRDESTGELRFISEEERETQRQRAMDIIRVHCE